MAVKAGFIRRWGWPGEDSGVSHDVWIGLLATAFRQRRYCDEPLVRYRRHEGSASGWIAGDADRARSAAWPAERRGRQSDRDLLVELFIKKWNLGWTDAFLGALQQDAAGLDPDCAAALIASLNDNRRNLTRRRRWWKF